MKSIKYLTICLLAFTVYSCASLSREQTNAWLSTKGGASTINMTGSWDSGGIATGGWGVGNFIQEGQRFYGTLGLYYVDGIVNGDDVYMAISSGIKVYYTARLKKSADGTFAGKAVQEIIIDKQEAQNAVTYLIMLKKFTGDQNPSGKNI
jgi:hypothetical protein